MRVLAGLAAPHHFLLCCMHLLFVGEFSEKSPPGLFCDVAVKIVVGVGLIVRTNGV
jgi:hypothetical protein